MTFHWKSWAIFVSIVWALVGANAGVHLAVAPAVSAYRHCVTSQTADEGACRTALQRDWADQSGDRLGYAALIGLAPIPVGWLILWVLFAPRRESRAAGRVERFAGRGRVVGPLEHV
jgi:hypothetical protein